VEWNGVGKVVKGSEEDGGIREVGKMGDGRWK
jgi:hypothetical protein